MGEMVERVARAICVARRWNPDHWYLAELEARAAIKAIRQPTMAMELAAQASDHQPSTIWGKMIEEALK